MYPKNACFSTQFFFDFSPFWPPKTVPKSMFFCYFLKNRRFCENPLKHWLCAQKSRFELEKNKKKTPKNRFPNVLEKNIAKNLSKFDFYSHLGLPKPFKTAPNRQNSPQKNPPKKKSLNRAMRLRSPHRKASLLGPSRTIQLPFQ